MGAVHIYMGLQYEGHYRYRITENILAFKIEVKYFYRRHCLTNPWCLNRRYRDL